MNLLKRHFFILTIILFVFPDHDILFDIFTVNIFFNGCSLRIPLKIILNVVNMCVYELFVRNSTGEKRKRERETSREGEASS